MGAEPGDGKRRRSVGEAHRLMEVSASQLRRQQGAVEGISGGRGVHRLDSKAWNERLGQFVTVFFLPIFFTYTGLRTNITGLDSWQLWGWCLATVFLATAGKFCASYLAARWVGMPRAEARVPSVSLRLLGSSP